ncbi:MAG TPA: FAD/NAD(P)-binding oxidoreductase [Acidimicrobiales bacterium]|nr:FAD/NAD(P)-binding oxidoreductase [Acidimicrobiales bacterium]
MPDPIVIAGASLAGLRAAEALRLGGYDGPLTIVGAEPHRPYDRPPLSKQVLTGDKPPESTSLPEPEGLDAEWVLGQPATGLDLERRRVLTAGGDIAFDGLVVATGAHPKILPPFPPGPGVHYLRTLDDSIALRDDLSGSRGLVVVGAGFIGLEVASSAQKLGVPVVVVEALPVPLERGLGPDMGRAVGEWLRSKGVDLRLGTGVEGLVGDGQAGGGLAGGRRPSSVLLSDGTEVEADTVVVGIGVAPSTEWLGSSGVDLGDGVVCDESLRVLAGGRPLPGVVAAGDVARWFHRGYGETVRIEHWTNASEAAEAAAATLLADRGGGTAEAFAPTPYFWSDQQGVKLQFVGRAMPGDDTTVVEGSFDEDRVLVAYGRAGRLVGALGIKRPARVMAFQRMIAAGEAYPPAE